MSSTKELVFGEKCFGPCVYSTELLQVYMREQGYYITARQLQAIVFQQKNRVLVKFSTQTTCHPTKDMLLRIVQRRVC